MDSKTQVLFEERARIIKALAHPSRLFIVDRLSRREHCVQELAELVGADMSTVSKHLSVLRSADIVRDEKRGTKVFYRLHMPCVLGFFSCVGKVIESSARDKAGLLE
jgi:DNA-binding transcriptional ArsR family regulator